MIGAPDPDRRAELVRSLGAVRARLTDAATAAGRDPRALTMIAVTKGFPADDVAILAGLGVTEFGESRDQEARAKLAELASAAAPASGLHWHFIGQLQSNKCRHVARYADVVHSVDRVDLATALEAGAHRVDRSIEVFVQISLDGDPTRGGAPPDLLADLAAVIAGSGHLRLAGVMAVAPQQADPDEAFARLAQVSFGLRDEYPGAVAISAGMSGDLEAAVRHGATHVRVGSALLGRRTGTFR